MENEKRKCTDWKLCAAAICRCDYVVTNAAAAAAFFTGEESEAGVKNCNTPYRVELSSSQYTVNSEIWRADLAKQIRIRKRRTDFGVAPFFIFTKFRSLFTIFHDDDDD